VDPYPAGQYFSGDETPDAAERNSYHIVDGEGVGRYRESPPDKYCRFVV
jgi:hypothetical protein